MDQRQGWNGQLQARSQRQAWRHQRDGETAASAETSGGQSWRHYRVGITSTETAWYSLSISEVPAPKRVGPELASSNWPGPPAHSNDSDLPAERSNITLSERDRYSERENRSGLPDQVDLINDAAPERVGRDHLR